MSSLLGTDGSPILQYLVVFAIMVVLLSLFALGAKRFARGRGALMGGAPRGRQPRLGIVDIYELDRQRQLILLRRDNVEHLLMVGGPNDLVVERDIRRSAARAQDDLVAAPERDAIPERGTSDRGPAEPEIVVASRAEPSLAPLPEPEPPAPVPPPRPAFPGVRSRRIEPPSLGAKPAEAPVAPEPPVAAPTPDQPTPPAADPEPVPPVLRMPPRPTANLDPAGASEMARDLERALGRPGAPVVSSRPPQAATAPAVQPPATLVLPPAPPPEPPPAPAPEVPPPAMEPVVEAPPPPPPAAPEPEPAPPPEPKVVPDAAPIVPAPPPPPKPPEASSKPPEASSKPPETPAKGATPGRPATTFSVEEIEAEFARLLGRPLDRKE